MSFEILLQREAQIDLDEIFVWYEEQKTGLGFDFITEFESTLNKISRNPYYASLVHMDARSASLKRFPYEIIYRINEASQAVRIIALIHHRRNPKWFKQRLRK